MFVRSFSSGRRHCGRIRAVRIAAMCAIGSLMLGSLGCRVALPATEVPRESNAELVEYIADLPYVTAEAVYRSLHILSFGNVFEGDYEALRAALSDGGLPVRDVEANVCLNRAQVGLLVASACEIKTGVNYQLTGLGRYAWRELQHLRIARTSGEYGYLSGGEFLGLLARAEEHLNPPDRGELGDAP